MSVISILTPLRGLHATDLPAICMYTGKYALTLRDINSIRDVRMSQYGREAGKHPRAGIGMSRRHRSIIRHSPIDLAR
jgi:hypothetical protein